MKLKFKRQAYQTDAVKAVVDCFAGQPKSTGLKYAIDPGRGAASGQQSFEDVMGRGFANERLGIPRSQLLVFRRANNYTLVSNIYIHNQALIPECRG